MYTSDVVKRQSNKKSIRWGALRTRNWFPWSFPKVTGDNRCAPKGIHCCKTSSKGFSNRIWQIYRYSLHCTKTTLDKGLSPLIKVLNRSTLSGIFVLFMFFSLWWEEKGWIRASYCWNKKSENCKAYERSEICQETRQCYHSCTLPR